MNVLIIVLLLVALLFLIFAAFNFSPSQRVSPGWFGLALLCLVFLIQRGLIG